MTGKRRKKFFRRFPVDRRGTSENHREIVGKGGRNPESPQLCVRRRKNVGKSGKTSEEIRRQFCRRKTSGNRRKNVGEKRKNSGYPATVCSATGKRRKKRENVARNPAVGTSAPCLYFIAFYVSVFINIISYNLSHLILVYFID